MGDSLKQQNISLTEIFDEHCPYYLSIGMSYDEFWFENPLRVIAYRKALQIKSEVKKYEFWEQGAYFYESLVNTSVLFRDFVKQGKATPYPERPYGIEEAKKSEDELQQEAENERLRAKIHFELLFKELTKHFEKNKAGEKNGR